MGRRPNGRKEGHDAGTRPMGKYCQCHFKLCLKLMLSFQFQKKFKKAKFNVSDDATSSNDGDIIISVADPGFAGGGYADHVRGANS